MVTNRTAFAAAVVAAVFFVAGCVTESDAVVLGPEHATTTTATPDDALVQVGDHWHSAYGIWVCDEFVDPIAEFTAPGNGGTHTHADGLIHIHPFSVTRTGTDATIANFLADATDQLGGTALGDDVLGVPGGATYHEGEDRCGVADATVSISVWDRAADAADGAPPDEVVTEDLDGRYFVSDHQAYTIAFSADPAEVPPPPAVRELGYVGVATSPPTTVPRPMPRALSGPLTFRSVMATHPPTECGDERMSTGLHPEFGADGAVVTCYNLSIEHLGGDVVASAEAAEEGGGDWYVSLLLTDDGIDEFNGVASECFARSDACPTGRLAIVVGNQVVSAPEVHASAFEAGDISISGGFDEDDALALAARLDG